jgi:hypothetical protein
MNKICIPTTLMLLLMATESPVGEALQLQQPSLSRRQAFASIATAAAASAFVIAPPASNALDMDAFANQQLKSSVCDDKKCAPKLTDDEALCRYGSPAQKTGEACVRAGLSTKRAGTLDAFGQSDRGDFARCKSRYEDKGDRYELVTECK